MLLSHTIELAGLVRDMTAGHPRSAADQAAADKAEAAYHLGARRHIESILDNEKSDAHKDPNFQLHVRHVEQRTAKYLPVAPVNKAPAVLEPSREFLSGIIEDQRAELEKLRKQLQEAPKLPPAAV
jgi:hypothetical protein